jgi:hypothetical protein
VRGRDHRRVTEVRVILKNRWAPVESYDGRWVVGSVGIVTAAGAPVLRRCLDRVHSIFA